MQFSTIVYDYVLKLKIFIKVNSLWCEAAWLGVMLGVHCPSVQKVTGDSKQTIKVNSFKWFTFSVILDKS